MLFRAVLAAAALSCTFSLALANTQGTELVQIKDLVCVLWLSGLKKEDLDVNLLKKLQRHNVNIDDILNNDTMQRECAAQKPQSISRTKMPVLKMKITATLSTTVDPAKSVNATRDKYIDTIVKLITTAQSSSNFTEEKNIDKTRRSPRVKNLKTKPRKPKYVKPNIPLDIDSKIRDETDFKRGVESDPKREVESDPKRGVEMDSKEDELKLQQNILKFWEKMSKTEMPRNVDEVLSTLPVVSSKNIFSQRLLSRPVPKLITPRPYFTTSTPLQSSDIERLIARFIERNMGQVSPTTTTTTTTTQRNIPDDLGEEFLPFYRDLIRRYNGRQTVEDDVSTQIKANNMLNDIPKRNYKEATEEPQEFRRNNMPNTAFRSFGNIFQNSGRNNNPFKKSMFAKLPYLEDIVSKQQEIVDTLYDNNRRSLRTSTVENKVQSHNVSDNTLQQIAESVKAIVLKDIGQLIKGTTASTQFELNEPPHFTTVRSSTFHQDLITTPKPEDKTDANHVMEKILEIYQRIKAFSANTELSLDAKYKQSTVNRDHSASSNVNIPPHSITNTNVIHRTSNVQNVLINPTSFQDLTQQEIRKMPAIIQTNSGEIAPLVLPMANPLKIINQILVVTTETAPIKKSVINEKIRGRFESFMEDLNKNKIHAVAQQKSYHNYNVPNHERYSHYGYSDVNRSYKDHFNVPRKHEPYSGELYDQSHRYRELHREANGKNRNYGGMEREHINYSEQVLGHADVEKLPQHLNEEKFHEQLEKGSERWGNRQDHMAIERDKGYSRHVAPRYQQPLNSKKPRYDDTHFRNFLKTQEKVNDMLEKILGKKAKFDEYSVESV